MKARFWLSHAVLFSVLLGVAVAQLEKCEFGRTCTKPGLECRTLAGSSGTVVKLCETNDRICFCAPDSLDELQECSTGDDCAADQRCGVLPDVTNRYCVGCRSIVVTIVPPDNCPGPSVQPISSPSSSSEPMDLPTVTPVSTFSPGTVTPNPNPSVVPGPEVPEVTPDEELNDSEGDMSSPEPVSDVSASPSIDPSVSSSPSVSSTVSASPTASLSFGASPSFTSSLSPSPSVSASISSEGVVVGDSESLPSVEATDDEPICIDAAALSHLPAHALVFSAHRRAAVLCDASGSCATPGHMVNFNGAAMMMRTYCDLVGTCSRSVRSVNSPKFSRALRIPSRTSGLSYLAFAARFESKAEEHVLRAIVRMGL